MRTAIVLLSKPFNWWFSSLHDSALEIDIELNVFLVDVALQHYFYGLFFVLENCSVPKIWKVVPKMGHIIAPGWNEGLDLSFNWGHHHLHLVSIIYMDVSRPADYFIACYTMLTRPNKVETAVQGCNSWLSVWTLSCRCPVKLSTLYQPCIIVCYSFYFWLIRSFRDPKHKQAAFSFGVLCTYVI